MLGLGSIGGKLRGAPEGAHAAAIAEGLGHLRKARFELDIRPGSTPMFHAGSSESWPGLQKAGGLIPGMNLKQEGIEVAAGEGLFSSIRRHSDVCVGQGAEGFGTARVYFDRLNESPRFSIRNYSDAQLERELSHFEEVERGEARSHLGLHRNRERNPTGFEQRLRLLRAERQHREGSGTPHYPVLFVFHHERLNPSPYVGGHYSAKLPGERWI